MNGIVAIRHMSGESAYWFFSLKQMAHARRFTDGLSLFYSSSVLANTMRHHGPLTLPSTSRRPPRLSGTYRAPVNSSPSRHLHDMITGTDRAPCCIECDPMCRGPAAPADSSMVRSVHPAIADDSGRCASSSETTGCAFTLAAAGIRASSTRAGESSVTGGRDCGNGRELPCL